MPALVQHIGAFSTKTAGTAITWLWTGSSQAGNVIVCGLVFDNAATASKPVVSSISKPAGETANWVFLGAARSTSTTAGAFASGELWAIRTTVDWTTPTITATLDTSVTMRSMMFSEYSGVQAVLRNTVGTNYSTTTTAASATTTGTTPSVNDLAIGLLFGSNVATVQAGDTDTTGGSWSAVQGIGSTGGNVNTNNMGVSQYKVLTAASHQTYNNSAAMTAGNGAIVAILQFALNPKISTIIDTFNTQIDPATWPTVAGNAVWEAGRVKTESLGAYSSISTAYAYDATDSSVFAKIVPPPGRNSRETILGLRTGAANDDGAYILVSGGPNARSLIYRRREGQTNYDTSESNGYDPAKHAYVRIRMSGTTQFKYDYSPDGTTWTDSGVTQTTAMNMTACRVALICGQWAAEPDTGFAYFDNVNTAGAPAKIGTLTDDFATSIDLYKWTVDDYNAPVVWEAGQVKMSCAISNYSWLTSLQAYDLRESSVFAKMTPPAQGRASREFNLRLGNNVNVNRVYFIITNDPKQFAARVRMNSVSTDSTWVPYDPVAHQWVRVRLTGTTMYWDVSPNGNTWNPFWSTTVDPSLFSSVTVAFECGQWQTEVDTGSGYVDNVNVLGVTGRPKVWTGSEYVQKPGKYWNGSAWVEKPWKEWDGSSWKTVK